MNGWMVVRGMGGEGGEGGREGGREGGEGGREGGRKGGREGGRFLSEGRTKIYSNKDSYYTKTQHMKHDTQT